MGNSSATNASKDSDVIAAIDDEKTKWHDTLSGGQHPDIVLINDMLCNTYQRLKGYVEQIHSKSIGIQKDLDKQTIALLEVQLEKLKTDNDALTIRLSRVVGEKLMKDNSNITDLSDKNRPTKLGEVYTELYDNEWTDAYEALTKSGYDDTAAIETLLRTLKVCFEFCHSKADQLLESTVKVSANVLFQESHEEMKDQKRKRQTLAVVPKQDNRSDVGDLKQFFFYTLSLQSRWKSKYSGKAKHSLEVLDTIYKPQSFEEELKIIRKKMSVVLIQVVQDAFLKTYWDDTCIPAMKPFIKKCLFLCWMMVVQGPPMCFDWSTEHGSKFDANLYRHYITSGTVVEFVVWPAIFLHKEGPLIAKGVAQPVKKTA